MPTDPSVTSLAPTTTLARRLTAALDQGDVALAEMAHGEAESWRDLLLTLTQIHDLHLGPIEGTAGRERYQHHPVVAGIKGRLESRLVAELDRRDAAAGWELPARPAAAMRAVAARGLVPPVYEWLAEVASLSEVGMFLALEGGPDGGFDDLVASCQIGLSGEAKLELARNYWDEMGTGFPDRVHTSLHQKLRIALRLQPSATIDMPTEALERTVLNGLLATNRWLQPELVGALGLIELQAGPRCRQVVRALNRVRAGDDALDFYVEHAEVDPRHGKAWVDHAVASLEASPRFAEGIVRGARWRSLVNHAFFTMLHEHFVTGVPLAS